MMQTRKFTDLYIDTTKKGTKIPQDRYLSTGRYPIVDQGRQIIAGYWEEPDGIFDEVPAIIFGDHTRAIKYIEKPFFIGADGVKILRPANEEDNPKYLYYALQAVKIPNLGYSRHFKVVKELEMRIYSREDQDTIVSKIERIDCLIEKRQNELIYLDELVKSRFIELFGDIIGNRTLPLIRLSELADIGSSKRIYANEYVESGIPFYRSKEIRELGTGLKPSVELFIKRERYDEIREKYGVPKVGDILIAAIGATIGYSWIVDTDSPFYYKDGNLIVLSIKDNVNPIFLNHAMGILIEDFKKKGVAGSAQLALTIEKLEKMMVVNPELELQNQFAAFVAQVDKSKHFSELEVAA